MDIQEYLKRYKNRLIDHWGFDSQFAQETIDAIPGEDIDLNDSPEDAADEELTYWGD